MRGTHWGIIPSQSGLIGKWRLRWKRGVHAHSLRRKIKTAAYKSERENDRPWGIHDNLLHLNCPRGNSGKGAGPDLKYLLLAPRFRTSADSESVYKIWE